MHIIIHIILTLHDAFFGSDFDSFCMFYQFLLKWLSALFQLGNHILTIPNRSFSLPLMNSRLIYPVLEGEILAVLVLLSTIKKIQFEQSQSDFTMHQLCDQVH